MKSYLVMSDETRDAGEKVMEIFEYDGTNSSAYQILKQWADDNLDSGLFEENFKFPNNYEGWADLLADRFDIYTELL